MLILLTQKNDIILCSNLLKQFRQVRCLESCNKYIHFSVSFFYSGNRCQEDIGNQTGQHLDHQADIDAMLLTGCYPPIYDRALDPANWFAVYVTAYVERDVRQMLKIHELETFQRFARLCAGEPASCSTFPLWPQNAALPITPPRH